jgi:GntR family transcriptional regulator
MATVLHDERPDDRRPDDRKLGALRPDPAGTGPLYLQLVDRLEAAIASGLYKDGDPLPPERVLAESLDVSRTTVRKALDELIRRGRVVSRHGSGNFIAARFEQPLARLSGFTDDMAARGRTSSFKWLERGRGRASPEETMALNLGPGDDVCHFVRLRFADGEPMCIERATIPARYLPDPHVVDQSLYAALRARGLEPVRALQHLRAAALSPADAAHLDLPAGTPVMATVRQGFLADDRPVEFTRSIYRADRYDFVAEMRLGQA